MALSNLPHTDAAPSGTHARSGRLPAQLLAPRGSTVPRVLTHRETRPVQGSSDDWVRSFYSDGSWIDRRYTAAGLLVDVDPVHAVAEV